MCPLPEKDQQPIVWDDSAEDVLLKQRTRVPESRLPVMTRAQFAQGLKDNGIDIQRLSDSYPYKNSEIALLQDLMRTLARYEESIQNPSDRPFAVALLLSQTQDLPFLIRQTGTVQLLIQQLRQVMRTGWQYSLPNMHFIWIGNLPEEAKANIALMLAHQNVLAAQDNQALAWRFYLGYDERGIMAYPLRQAIFKHARFLVNKLPELSREPQYQSTVIELQNVFYRQVRQQTDTDPNAYNRLAIDFMVNQLGNDRATLEQTLQTARSSCRAFKQEMDQRYGEHLLTLIDLSELMPPTHVLYPRYIQELWLRDCLPAAVDLLRSLMLNRYGGTYVDVDVSLQARKAVFADLRGERQEAAILRQLNDIMAPPNLDVAAKYLAKSFQSARLQAIYNYLAQRTEDLAFLAPLVGRAPFELLASLSATFANDSMKTYLTALEAAPAAYAMANPGEPNLLRFFEPLRQVPLPPSGLALQERRTLPIKFDISVMHARQSAPAFLNYWQRVEARYRQMEYENTLWYPRAPDRLDNNPALRANWGGYYRLDGLSEGSVVTGHLTGPFPYLDAATQAQQPQNPDLLEDWERVSAAFPSLESIKKKMAISQSVLEMDTPEDRKSAWRAQKLSPLSTDYAEDSKYDRQVILALDASTETRTLARYSANTHQDSTIFYVQGTQLQRHDGQALNKLAPEEWGKNTRVVLVGNIFPNQRTLGGYSVSQIVTLLQSLTAPLAPNQRAIARIKLVADHAFSSSESAQPSDGLFAARLLQALNQQALPTESIKGYVGPIEVDVMGRVWVQSEEGMVVRHAFALRMLAEWKNGQVEIGRARWNGSSQSHPQPPLDSVPGPHAITRRAVILVVPQSTWGSEEERPFQHAVESLSRKHPDTEFYALSKPEGMNWQRYAMTNRPDMAWQNAWRPLMKPLEGAYRKITLLGHGHGKLKLISGHDVANVAAGLVTLFQNVHEIEILSVFACGIASNVGMSLFRHLKQLPDLHIGQITGTEKRFFLSHADSEMPGPGRRIFPFDGYLIHGGHDFMWLIKEEEDGALIEEAHYSKSEAIFLTNDAHIGPWVTPTMPENPSSALPSSSLPLALEEFFLLGADEVRPWRHPLTHDNLLIVRLANTEERIAIIKPHREILRVFLEVDPLTGKVMLDDASGGAFQMVYFDEGVYKSAGRQFGADFTQLIQPFVNDGANINVPIGRDESLLDRLVGEGKLYRLGGNGMLVRTGLPGEFVYRAHKGTNVRAMARSHGVGLWRDTFNDGSGGKHVIAAGSTISLALAYRRAFIKEHGENPANVRLYMIDVEGLPVAYFDESVALLNDLPAGENPNDFLRTRGDNALPSDVHVQGPLQDARVTDITDWAPWDTVSGTNVETGPAIGAGKRAQRYIARPSAFLRSLAQTVNAEIDRMLSRIAELPAGTPINAHGRVDIAKILYFMPTLSLDWVSTQEAWSTRLDSLTLERLAREADLAGQRAHSESENFHFYFNKFKKTLLIAPKAEMAYDFNAYLAATFDGLHFAYLKQRLSNLPGFATVDQSVSHFSNIYIDFLATTLPDMGQRTMAVKVLTALSHAEQLNAWAALPRENNPLALLTKSQLQFMDHDTIGQLQPAAWEAIGPAKIGQMRKSQLESIPNTVVARLSRPILDVLTQRKGLSYQHIYRWQNLFASTRTDRASLSIEAGQTVFEQRRQATLLRMLFLASPEERAAFKAGRAHWQAELATLDLAADAPLARLQQVFLQRDTLSPRQQGALLAAMAQRQAKSLAKVMSAWHARIAEHGGTALRAIAHNRYLAATGHQHGLCGGLTAHLAAAYLADAAAGSAFNHYLDALETATREPDTPMARLLDLSLVAWRFAEPEQVFAANPSHDGLSVAAVLDILKSTPAPAAFELVLGNHALLLAKGGTPGAETFLFADPNFGRCELLSPEALSTVLEWHGTLVHELFAPDTATLQFNLRRYRADLTAQKLFATQSAGSLESLTLADLARPDALATRLNAARKPLEQRQSFQRLERRLAVLEYRQSLQGLSEIGSVNQFLAGLLARHQAAAAQSRVVGITFDRADALLVVANPAGQTGAPIRIDGKRYPADVAVLQRFDDLRRAVASGNDQHGRLKKLLLPRTPAFVVDRQRLTSALPDTLLSHF